MLLVQGIAQTSPISSTAYSWEISNALYYAAIQIPTTGKNPRECNNFGVYAQTLGSNVLKLIITFQVENVKPLTMLQVYKSFLSGMLSYLIVFNLIQK